MIASAPPSSLAVAKADGRNRVFAQILHHLQRVGRRAEQPVPIEDVAGAVKENQPLVDLLKRSAEQREPTPAQIALAWLLAKRPWIVPIPGATKLRKNVEVGPGRNAFKEKLSLSNPRSDSALRGEPQGHDLDRADSARSPQSSHLMLPAVMASTMRSLRKM
jgi:hypothetical protein